MEVVENRFIQGLKDSVPIGLGYLSVSFTFGMMCVSSGIPVEIAVVISLTNLTSAGQFNGLILILEAAPLMELAMSQFIINLRYALMSLSLSQKIDKKMSTLDRAFISFGITDEIFALASSTYERVGRNYMLGLILFPVFCWTLGTFIGGSATAMMPETLRNALGIAIYGMFLAIIIPPAKKLKNVRKVLIFSIILSCFFELIKPVIEISSGFVIILCTILAAGLGAYFFPVKEIEHE